MSAHEHSSPHSATGHRRPILDPVASLETWPVVSAGLLGGYTTARVTGNRPLGGAVLAAAGVVAGRTWLARRGAPTTAALTGIYLASFGLSHPLAKKLGAWPSVLTATAAAATAAHLLSDTAPARV